MANFFKWSAISWSALLALFFVWGVFRMFSSPPPESTGTTLLIALVIGAAGYVIVWAIVAVPCTVLWVLTKRD